MWKPRRRVRCIEPLPKMYAQQYSKSNMGLRKMHERGPPQSAFPAHAGRESGPESGRKQLFSGSDGGFSRGVCRAIHWFLHKFNVYLVDTL